MGRYCCWLLFVLLSSLALLKYLFRGARQGGKSALWMVKNVFFNEVKLDPNQPTAKARHELVISIQTEHFRMVRIMCCKRCLHRFFPFWVKGPVAHGGNLNEVSFTSGFTRKKLPKSMSLHLLHPCGFPVYEWWMIKCLNGKNIYIKNLVDSSTLTALRMNLVGTWHCLYPTTHWWFIYCKS
jgi:hypothetical protein